MYLTLALTIYLAYTRLDDYTHDGQVAQFDEVLKICRILF